MATAAAVSTGVLIFALLIFVVVESLFIISLRKALEKCSPASRAMDPGMLWLLLIPILNVVWNFVVVNNMAKSLGNEFRLRGIPNAEAEPGKTVGLAMSALGVAVWIPKLVPSLATIGTLAGLAGLVLFGIYWFKINGYSRMLDVPPGYPVAGYPAAGYPQPGAPMAGYPAYSAAAPAAGYPPQPGYPAPGASQAGYPAYPTAGAPVAGYPAPGVPQAGYPAYPAAGAPAPGYPVAATPAPGYPAPPVAGYPAGYPAAGAPVPGYPPAAPPASATPAGAVPVAGPPVTGPGGTPQS